MHLAQLNLAKAKYSLDAPEIADFVNNLDIINALAESSEGFIWRLKDESGDATAIDVMNDPDMLVNMSVWKSVETLKDFMFRTHHKDFMARKKEWFHPMLEANYVLCWIAPEHTPTVEEAIERLTHLRANGESPYAFSFRRVFQP
ncbi:DUF3291 domain-containing protein [Neptunicella marina]|uniref:DUF3291 domain-containing protein n=1 Tax=Neptunicella marina TaxID=2125989 RepID=A0A8J6IVH8_9ALTE|nr:DUF3291 domain-containing protein [Neptunicella marina]MBC3767129.1 DUF3291 domain-containing protein [Neptunicella marina]